jgi:hypothetical protein
MLKISHMSSVAPTFKFVNEPDPLITEEEQRRLDVFLQLSRLERGLRRFVEAELRRNDGAKWTKALPNDVKEKVSVRGLEHTDFPDLKKILGSAWSKFGGAVAQVNKSHVLIHLEGLEPIRNDIAHSRDVSEGQQALVEAAYHVVYPLVATSEPNRELPPTEHPRIALVRLQAALTHSVAAPRVDMDLLRSADGHEELCEAVDNYERVRRRPGRDQKLMASMRSNALTGVGTAISSIEEEKDDPRGR